MPLYLTLSEGPRADQARPILALSDRRVIDAMLREIGRLGDEPAGDEEREPPSVGPLHVVKRRRDVAAVRP